MNIFGLTQIYSTRSFTYYQNDLFVCVSSKELNSTSKCQICLLSFQTRTLSSFKNPSVKHHLILLSLLFICIANSPRFCVFNDKVSIGLVHSTSNKVHAPLRIPKNNTDAFILSLESWWRPVRGCSLNEWPGLGCLRF